MTLVIKNGSVYADGKVIAADVKIEGGVIKEIGRDLKGDQEIDASGCWVGPGLVDIHVHFREPGQEWKEDISTGMAAAAAGGFTTVAMMPNTDPPIDCGVVARQVMRNGDVRALAVGAITAGRKGERLARLDELWDAGVRIFSDDGDTVADAGLLRRAMEYLAQLSESAGEPVLISQHPEDLGLCRGGQMHEGSVSSRLGLAGLPSIGEEVVVARDLYIGELTGCPYHVQHVSTKGTVELLRQAKAKGLKVTGEVTPHHLAFDHSMVDTGDPTYKMYPPLRTPEDVEAVREALKEGVIDIVATDHAPHAAFEKEVPFEEAPRGVIGLETSVSVVHQICGLSQAELFERMSVIPAKLIGLDVRLRVGGPADLVVFDPNENWVVEGFRSKSSNSPWLGKEMNGGVKVTIHDGRVVFKV